jgi:dienelactone hydrolase
MTMRQKTTRGTLLTALATSVIAAPGSLATPPIRHHRHARPNLTVSSGSVRLSQGRIVGSFTVRDAGRARAGRSQAELSMTVSRKQLKLGVFSIAVLKPGARAKVTVSVGAPAGVPAGSYPVLACADVAKKVTESSERDNCARLGQVTFPSPSTSTPPPNGTIAPVSTPPTTPPPPVNTQTTPTQPQPGPTQVPTDRMTIEADEPTLVHDSYGGQTGSYYVTTPPSYDVSGATPMRLLVWMHGCGGEAEGDSYEMIASNKLNGHGEVQDDEGRDFIVISIGGTDGGCWNPDTEVVKVLMAIADVTTHFNVDRRHIFIAGYSSGGDLAYRTIFYNADEFAGILAVNTNPFRDTGSTEAQSMAAAAWKFNIAQVAHSEDTEYHPNACTDCLEGGGNDPGVTPAVNDLRSAGYHVEYEIRPGTHFDEDDFVNHTGTDYDFRQYALPFIDDPTWEAPS